jgi:hypothetical protein
MLFGPHPSLRTEQGVLQTSSNPFHRQMASSLSDTNTSQAAPSSSSPPTADRPQPKTPEPLAIRPKPVNLPSPPTATLDPHDKHTNPQHLSIFFRLPPEVRIQIYEHVLDHHAPTPASFAGAGTAAPTPRFFLALRRPVPALAAACRLAYAELVAEAQATTALRVRWHRGAVHTEAALHGRLAPARVRRLDLVVATPGLHVLSRFVYPLLGRLPRLRELALLWRADEWAGQAAAAAGMTGIFDVARREREAEVKAIRRARTAEFVAAVVGVGSLRRVTLVGAVPGELGEMLRNNGVEVVVREWCCKDDDDVPLDHSVTGGCAAVSKVPERSLEAAG